MTSLVPRPPLAAVFFATVAARGGLGTRLSEANSLSLGTVIGTPVYQCRK